MANNARSPSPLTLAAFLVAGVALGWFIRGNTGSGINASTAPAPTSTATPEATATATPLAPSPTCIPLGATGNMMILVGPTEVQVYPDCLTIAAATDTITWNPTNSSSSTLFIEFDEKLFTNMSQVMTNKRWRVTHSGSTSYSGHVLKTYPQNTKIEYKYHQILNGKDYDGRIIIKW